VDLRGIGYEGVDLMHLVQDRDQWWAPVNTVMNLHMAKRQGMLHEVS